MLGIRASRILDYVRAHGSPDADHCRCALAVSHLGLPPACKMSGRQFTAAVRRLLADGLMAEVPYRTDTYTGTMLVPTATSQDA